MVANLLAFSILYSTVLSPLFHKGSDVKFRHYSRSINENNDLVLDYYLDHTYHDFYFNSMNPNVPTVMYMHGFLGDQSVGRQFCNATNIQYRGKVNCIVIDWTIVSHYINYYQVKNEVKEVAKVVGYFMQDLIVRGHKTENFILIGHSLGAHLCGLSTRRLDRSFGKVNTIVGLDPAGPGFSYDDIENRLDRTDADYVLVLHTDTRMYGMREAIGHADVYVNGGRRQPGCKFLPLIKFVPIVDRIHYCSHLRAETLWIEMVSTNFKLTRCKKQYGLFKEYFVLESDTTEVIGPQMTYGRGVFYLETYGKSPFVKPLDLYKKKFEDAF